jgi:hypothetical protein
LMMLFMSTAPVVGRVQHLAVGSFSSGSAIMNKL